MNPRGTSAGPIQPNQHGGREPLQEPKLFLSTDISSRQYALVRFMHIQSLTSIVKRSSQLASSRMSQSGGERERAKVDSRTHKTRHGNSHQSHVGSKISA